MDELYLNRRDIIKVSLASAFALSCSTTALHDVILDKEKYSSPGPEKKDPHLKTLSDRPLNAETPPHLLDDEITPTDRLFVRNNGLVPDIAYGKGIEDWRLTIDGELEKNGSFSLAELRTNFKTYRYPLVLECGGNGRAGFNPETSGNQWTYGAMGCPEWEGVRLKDVLNYLGVKKTAVYVGYYSHDIHPSGDLKKVVISRGFPIEKALDDMTLIAFALNGSPLPPLHGFPARLVCPGYPASASGKWLKRLWIRDKVHDGEHMLGQSYRMPRSPVRPGEQVPEQEMDIITQMPIKSLITFPKSGTKQTWQGDKTPLHCRGFAWTGADKVTQVDVSFDFGQTWIRAKLKDPANRFAWQRWEATLLLPTKGYFEIWARAQDTTGKQQPMVVPGWNPKGYLNNAMPRIAVEMV